MTNQEIFDIARKLYPGTKIGLTKEFGNFKKKHKDWKKVLPLLKPAIEAQIQWRSTSDWTPCWKGFSVWINQSQWELELPVSESAASKPSLHLIYGKNCETCGMPAVYKSVGGMYDHHSCGEHMPEKVRAKYA